MKLEKPPETMAQLRGACALVMAGAINNEIKEADGRLALNAATRIIESVQAETRARALAFAMGMVIPNEMPLDGPIFSKRKRIEGP